MRIDRTASQGMPSVRRKGGAGETDGTGFDNSLKQAGGETNSGVAAGGGVDPGGALLALQEVPDAVAQRSKARQNAQRVLDRLEQLRFDLLEGRIPAETIERLAQEVEHAQSRTDDPELNDILDEIQLRAQVELAKLGR